MTNDAFKGTMLARSAVQPPKRRKPAAPAAPTFSDAKPTELATPEDEAFDAGYQAAADTAINRQLARVAKHTAPKTTRITVDLDEEHYRALTELAADRTRRDHSRVSLAAVVRDLIRQAHAD